MSITPNPIVVPLEVSTDAESVVLETAVNEPGNYNTLVNKPSINGVTLEGNMASEDLDLVDVSEMGSLGDLYTEDKSSIVNAINELQNEASDAIQRCGNLIDLSFLAENLVDAINLLASRISALEGLEHYNISVTDNKLTITEVSE